MRRMIQVAIVVLAALSGIAKSCSSVALAGEWPDKPVKIIVPFAAGGTSDILGRVIADYLSKKFNNAFIVDNRAGALGLIGCALVAKAEPDGYTLLLSSLAANIIAPAFTGNATYDGVRSFTHIAYLGGPPVGLLVHSSLGVSTYAEFLAWAKAQRAPIDFVSSGIATNGYLFGMALAQKEHLNFNHIPYKGGAPAMLDLLAGRIRVATITFSTAVEQVRSGAVKVLAVSTQKRIAAFPDIPTFKELGYDDMNATSWFALSGPPNLPKEIVEKLNREVISLMQDAEIQKRLAQESIETHIMTPAQVTAFFESENTRWTPIAKAVSKEK